MITKKRCDIWTAMLDMSWGAAGLSSLRWYKKSRSYKLWPDARGHFHKAVRASGHQIVNAWRNVILNKATTIGWRVYGPCPFWGQGPWALDDPRRCPTTPSSSLYHTLFVMILRSCFHFESHDLFDLILLLTLFTKGNIRSIVTTFFARKRSFFHSSLL